MHRLATCVVLLSSLLLVAAETGDAGVSSEASSVATSESEGAEDARRSSADETSETEATGGGTTAADSTSDASNSEVSTESGELDAEAIAPVLRSEQAFFPETGRCLSGFVTYRPPSAPESGDEDYRYARMVHTESDEALGLVARGYYDNPNGDDQAKWMGFVRDGAWWGATYPPEPVTREESLHLEHARRGWKLMQSVDTSFDDGILAEQFRIDDVERNDEGHAIVTMRPARGCTIGWAGLSVTRVRLEVVDPSGDPNVLRVWITTPAGKTHLLFSGKVFERTADTCLETVDGMSWPTMPDLFGRFVDAVRESIEETTSDE
jgi:hypothetical protein